MTKDRTLKLTISLLASNRKDTIPKCLESLRPLLDNVDSELIITDTGCDEDLVEFMHGYTDEIVKFQWCHDFAAARNVGLQMARGQWFMFIDDDEWFEDVTEIVRFFNSDEEKQYVSADYVVRNYYDMSGTGYNEGVVGRIFRIYDDTVFVGKVHECVARKEGAVKQFTAYVHHYGYVFENEEKKLEHFKRNSELLKKEIEENPKDARNYAHIYQEYKQYNNTDKILEYATKAMENVDENYKGSKISLCSTYVAILWAYIHKSEYTEVIKWGEDILKHKSVTGLSLAAIKAHMAEAYVACEEYEKCIEYVDGYLRLYHMFADDKERFYKELGPMLNDTFKEARFGSVLSAGIESKVKLGDVSGVYQYLMSYDWSQNIYMKNANLIKDVADISVDYEDFDESVRVFGKIFTHSECSKLLLERVMELKNTEPDKYMKVCQVMSQVAGQYGYNYLVQLITANRVKDIESLKKIYKNIVQERNNILMMENEFYSIAINSNISLGNLIESIDTAVWKEMLNEWGRRARNKDIVRVKKYMDKILLQESIYMKMLEEKILKILAKRKK